jgi:hypothetical protein
MRQSKFHSPSAVSFVMAIALLAVASAQSSNQGRWADANDPIAKQLIEQERKWAVLECEPSNVVAEALADDFVGTSPRGPRYTKAEALAEAPPAPGQARDCKLLTARVRFYGNTVAMIYGSETSVRKQKDGKEFDRTLIWTDTWLRRDGKWQIIGVQDMIAPKE